LFSTIDPAQSVFGIFHLADSLCVPLRCYNGSILLKDKGVTKWNSQ
jgi:hypothetical protein